MERAGVPRTPGGGGQVASKVPGVLESGHRGARVEPGELFLCGPTVLPSRPRRRRCDGSLVRAAPVLPRKNAPPSSEVSTAVL